VPGRGLPGSNGAGSGFQRPYDGVVGFLAPMGRVVVSSAQ